MESMAKKLREQQQKRQEKLRDAKQRASEKARYTMMLEEQKRQKEIEAEKRKEFEAAEKIRKEEERAAKEIEEKTHKYFNINQYNRRVPIDGMPMYFGEVEYILPRDKNSAWRPHGIGEFHFDGSIHYECYFRHGRMFGDGKYRFNDDTTYFGEFYDGNMHGKGCLVSTKEKSDVLVRSNIVICRRDGVYVL